MIEIADIARPEVVVTVYNSCVKMRCWFVDSARGPGVSSELAGGVIRDAREHISSSFARTIELHLSCVRMLSWPRNVHA